MDVSSYASDLTDAEWALLKPLVARSHPAGRRQTYLIQRIIGAILALLIGTCAVPTGAVTWST
jgi:putative transposase